MAATTESRTNPHPTNHQDHLGRGVSEVDGRNDLSRNVDAINREEPQRTRGPQHNHLGRWTAHCRGQEGEANGDDKHRDRVHQPVVGLTPGGQMIGLWPSQQLKGLDAHQRPDPRGEEIETLNRAKHVEEARDGVIIDHSATGLWKSNRWSHHAHAREIGSAPDSAAVTPLTQKQCRLDDERYAVETEAYLMPNPGAESWSAQRK